MKRIFAVIILLLALTSVNLKSNAATFEQAFTQSKPMLVLVYASWADDANNAIAQVKSTEKVFGNSLNYSYLNIASPEAKAYNQLFPILTNMPYVLLLKNKGKINRVIAKDCVLDNACLMKKIKAF